MKTPKEWLIMMYPMLRDKMGSNDFIDMDVATKLMSEYTKYALSQVDEFINDKRMLI
jgi:hypothetical protein